MSQKTQYPTRCKIIDVDGLNHKIGPHTAKTPDESRPHIGKDGIAEEISEEGFRVIRITLDDGTIVYGNDCWWTPLNENP